MSSEKILSFEKKNGNKNRFEEQKNSEILFFVLFLKIATFFLYFLNVLFANLFEEFVFIGLLSRLREIWKQNEEKTKIFLFVKK